MKMKTDRRNIEIAVVSDCHLGTYGSKSRELYQYLKSIRPGILILNGDIIDFWQFSKRYWPKYHMKVIKEIINMASRGVKVYYIAGNHDETLRKFSNLTVGNIMITNKLELNLAGKKYWFFHGDVFDVIMQHSRWLEKAGAIGYDTLILLNVLINAMLKLFGKGKISISKRIKENVKSAVTYISNFEYTAAVFAHKKGYDAIVCGHIHKPGIKKILLEEGGSIEYLNSGDWVENNTALEYQNGEWTIYYHADTFENGIADDEEILMELNNREIFKRVLKEFQL